MTSWHLTNGEFSSPSVLPNHLLRHKSKPTFVVLISITCFFLINIATFPTITCNATNEQQNFNNKLIKSNQVSGADLLLASGSASLSITAPVAAIQQQQQQHKRNNNKRRALPDIGKLVDGDFGIGARRKLDYIAEFLSTLPDASRFAKLLMHLSPSSSSTNQLPSSGSKLNNSSDSQQLASLSATFEALDAFTLFVPTNEALADSFLDSNTTGAEFDSELRRLVLAHASDALILPQHARRNSTLFSLAGSALRVSTLTGGIDSSASRGGVAGGAMLVNGATMLTNHSYALQEKPSQQARNSTGKLKTYAIVHVINASLLPLAKQMRAPLLARMRELAPVFASFVEQFASLQLLELLKRNSSNAEIADELTAFVPNDSAFAQLVGQLANSARKGNSISTQTGGNSIDTITSSANNNQPISESLMRELAESHFAFGLNFGAHLRARAESANLTQQSLRSLANTKLHFSSISQKDTQNPIIEKQSTGVSVNSIPIRQTDLLAVSSVLHLLDGLLIEPKLLLACPACQSVLPAIQVDNLISLTDSLTRSESVWHRKRSERSQDSIVTSNNRNFYKPSIEPPNLLLSNNLSDQPKRASLLPASFGEMLMSASLRNSSSAGQIASINTPLTATSGETRTPIQPQVTTTTTGDGNSVEVYKIVLDANSRQQLRQQQQLNLVSNNSNLTSERRQLLFAYDEPLARLASAKTNKQQQPQQQQQLYHNYTWPTSASASATIATTATTTTTTTSLGTFNNNKAMVDQQTADSAQKLIKFSPQDAKTLPTTSNDDLRFHSNATGAQLTSNVGGSKSFGALNPSGCSFFDQTCRQQWARLVHLPPRATPLANLQAATKGGGAAPSVLVVPHHVPSQQQQNAPIVSLLVPLVGVQNQPAHIDSTFGEISSQLQHNLRLHQQQQQQHLQQPLPPWTRDELGTNSKGGNSNPLLKLRPLDQEAELARITINNGSTTNTAISDNQQQQQQQQLQLHGHGFASGLSRLTASQFGTKTQQTTGALQQQPHFESKTFYRPTPKSISTHTTHRPAIFGPPDSFGKLNIGKTDFGKTISEKLVSNSFSDQQQQQVNVGNNSLDFDSNSGAFKSATPSPAPLKAAKDSFASPALAGQLASPATMHRKFKQLQQQQIQQVQQVVARPVGDMTITAAGHLSAVASSSQAQLQRLELAPSDQSSVPQNIRGLLTNKEALADTTSEAEALAAATRDFFQNRTIAQIMDDSGLRIEGQHVTFARVKECLRMADLLNFVSQELGESITIFLPTDEAYERLIQQQVLAHRAASLNEHSQRRGGARFQPNINGQLLPLVGSLPSTSNPLLAKPSILALESGSPFASGNNLQTQLSLDCASGVVRRLLLDHIIARLLIPKSLQAADLSVTNLNGRQLLVSSVPEKRIVVVDGQPVIAATRASNGMVYVVNKFLNVSSTSNVVDLLANQPSLSKFTSLLRQTKLDETLKSHSGPLTVLAATNDAFDKLSRNARHSIETNPEIARQVMRAHIVEGAQYGKLVSLRNSFTTLDGKDSIGAQVIKPNSFMLDGQLTGMRFVGSSANGIVNAIDTLIVPQRLSSRMTVDRFSGELFSSSRVASPNSLAAAGERLSLGSTQPGAASEQLQPQSSSSSSSNNHLLGDNQTERTNNNMQLIEKLAKLLGAEKFVEYLKKTNISSTLHSDMSYVILVPSDDAIDHLPKRILLELDRDRRKLNDLIAFHILDTSFEYINTIPDGASLTSINDKNIIFNWHRNNTKLTASGAVITHGVQEDNFALFLVDRVLYPSPGDILSIIKTSPILSNLSTIVHNAGLEDQLARAGPFTLFAPSDAAFSSTSFNSKQVHLLANNKDLARKFLLRHMSQPAHFTSAISLSQQAPASLLQRQQQHLHANNNSINNFNFERQNNRQQSSSSATLITNNLLDEELKLEQSEDIYRVNSINFSYSDVAATNGVIHVIEGIL